MEKKVKFAIIGLVGLLLVSFIIVLQITNSKQILEKQIDKLNSDNVNLSKEINNFSAEKKRLQDRLDSLNSQMSRLESEKEDLNDKCDLLEKARDGLIEKLKSAEEVKAAPAEQPVKQITQPSYPSPKEDIYWADVLKAKTDLEFQLDTLRAQLKDLESANEKLQREKSMFQLDITNLAREKDSLDHQIGYNQKLMDSISAELVREKNERMQQQDELKVLKDENALLTRQVKNLTNSKVNLEKRFYEMEEKNKQLGSKLAEMDTVLKEKMYLVENIKRQLVSTHQSIKGAGTVKDTVELPAIVVKPQADAQNEKPVFSKPPAPAPIGKVLSINRDNKFVIVDISGSPQVKLGDTFRIYRNNSCIARIEVIRIRDAVAACDIKQEFTPIAEGDIIK